MANNKEQVVTSLRIEPDSINKSTISEYTRQLKAVESATTTAGFNLSARSRMFDVSRMMPSKASLFRLGAGLRNSISAGFGGMMGGGGGIIGSLMSPAALGAGAIATTNMFSSRVQEIDDLSKKTGVASNTIIKLQEAMKLSGRDSKALAGDLQGLASTFAMAGMRGVDIEKQLLRMGDRMKGMTLPQAINIGKRFGISEETIMFLRKGSKEVEKLKEMTKKGLLISDKDRQTAQQYNEIFRNLSAQVRGTGMEMARALLPAASEMMKLANNIAVNLGNIISSASSGIGKIVSWFTSDQSKDNWIVKSIKEIGIAAEDLFASMQGKNSVVGESAGKTALGGVAGYLVGGLKGAGVGAALSYLSSNDLSTAQKIGAGVGAIGGLLSPIPGGMGLGAIAGATLTKKEFTKPIVNFGNYVSDTFKNIKFSDDKNVIKPKEKQNIFSETFAEAKQLFSGLKIKDVITSGKDYMTKDFYTGKKEEVKKNVQNNITNNIKIDVQSTDPLGAAYEMENLLKQWTAQTLVPGTYGGIAQ